MPQLPTLTVAQDIADRVIAAFGGDRDAYLTWLRKSLTHRVWMFENMPPPEPDPLPPMPPPDLFGPDDPYAADRG